MPRLHTSMLFLFSAGMIHFADSYYNKTTSPPLTVTGSVKLVATSPPTTTAVSAAMITEAPTTYKSALTSPSTNLHSPLLPGPSANMSDNTSLPSTSNETSATNQPSSQITTLPPSTQSNTMASTTARSTDQKCSYSVDTIQFGFLIKMTDFTPGNYTIAVAEEDGQFERKVNVSFPSKNSTHEIKPLKPCTEYRITVTLIGINEIPCYNTGNKNKTTGMNKEEIKKASCPSGYFCYQSGWNISSLSFKHNKVSSSEFINGSYRFKPAYEDICSDFVLKFPEENCSNFSLMISEHVPVDFIDPNDINQTQPTELPPNINIPLPPSCKNLTVDELKCLDKDNETVERLDMKPFTNYSCTRDIENNNVSIKKTTPPVRFNIDCDFTIIKWNSSSTNTSIKLNWETKSDKCQGVLHNLTELSYDCSCLKDGIAEEAVKKSPNGGTCDIRGLTPYKDYKCKVNAIYKTKTFKETIVEVKTKPGTPGIPTKIHVEYPVNNEIKVTCNGPSDFFGNIKRYIAELDGIPDSKRNQSKCDFEFKDLSYSTTYTLKVSTHNGYFQSPIETKQATTYYNDKALIASLIFLMVIICVVPCVAFFIMKRRKSRSVVNEEQVINLTGIYANMPPPKRNNKTY